MYLTGESYLSDYVPSSKEQSENIAAIINSPFRVKGVVISLGYWRKANAIHRWFVINVQNGKDDCGHYCVTTAHLKTLLDTVRAVLKDHSKATELLPGQNGFLFGETEYNEYYFQTLEYTEEIIKKVLDSGIIGEYDIKYHSSW